MKQAKGFLAVGVLALAACGQSTEPDGADAASEASALATAAITSFSVEHSAAADEYLLQ